MTQDDYILEFQNVTKRFPGIIANDKVNLKIKRGEIHALLGENGAGKSTLMNVLVGLYTPDEGQILMNGEKVEIKSPKDSIHLGIGMVHQHFKLVEELSVMENIVIGYEKQGFALHKKATCKQLEELSEHYHLPIDPKALIRDLSAGEKQRVEIVKMLYRNVNFLILDEPTSVLTPQEAEKLFDYLREMKADNKTVIFISHKLDEVMAIADRVTILRQGKLIETMEKAETNPKDLARKMIGKEMQSIEKKINDHLDNAPVIIAGKNLNAKGDEGVLAIKDVNIEIRQGEILGIAGVSGNGQSELAQVLTGLRHLESGQITVNGKEIRGGAMSFINAKVGHIPEDRIGTGSIPSFSVLENVILKKYKKPPIKRGPFIDYRKAAYFGKNLLKEFDVRMPSYDMPVKLLSGGNMQKLIFAREIDNDPQVIIAVHPSYGLDVLAVDMVHQYLIKEQQRGCAILLISEDLDEILTLSDSIAVMYKHTLTPKRNRNDWTIDEIGYAMMGIGKNQATAQDGGEHIA